MVSLLFFFFLLITLCPSSSAAANTTTEYLKLPLLHKTPFTSPSEALAFDINRRLSLLHHHRHQQQHKQNSFRSPVISGASSGSGQYFVSLRIGTPPQTLLLVADTGSDLIWVKCSPCRNCSHRSPGSAFFARHSTTYSAIHCYSPQCQLVPHPHPNPCNRTRLHSPCRYQYTYADSSTTTGFFSKEALTLNTSTGKVKKLNGLSFGCGFRISGPSLTGASFEGAQGVMGLGRAPISFSSQLGRRFGSKFSYCLMDYTLSPPPTSFLTIGGAQNVAVSKKGIMSFTPLLINPLSPTFYYIAIKGVYVNGVKLPINPSVWSIDDLGNGGTIIDSGTTLTFITEPAYTEILKAFKKRVKLPSPAEPTPGFDLCMNVSGVTRPALPRMSFNLAGGSVFSPPPRNYFIETGDQIKCLAVQPVSQDGGFSVLGNLMQQGFLLEFDRDKSRLGFTRRGCALP
ncbi:aspartyl protease family protein 2 [Ricinus communis]|uniref:Basic 7S globulin 2 small subunit, putative n=1 Tax=Ricinus communis TaxID=3988 RepID=B9SEI2_RICCO|nr:aspartyl protease family protein 2 [Ricinus communis]EEF38012.1 basic 7S globulin 2 precursor small subunit, putative [Ricinus communis]|eukprot:XP_002524401.1 aspartyl protease family protein 2 [Ricinus communis]